MEFPLIRWAAIPLLAALASCSTTCPAGQPGSALVRSAEAFFHEMPDQRREVLLRVHSAWVEYRARQARTNQRRLALSDDAVLGLHWILWLRTGFIFPQIAGEEPAHPDTTDDDWLLASERAGRAAVDVLVDWLGSTKHPHPHRERVAQVLLEAAKHDEDPWIRIRAVQAQRSGLLATGASSVSEAARVATPHEVEVLQEQYRSATAMLSVLADAESPRDDSLLDAARYHLAGVPNLTRELRAAIEAEEYREANRLLRDVQDKMAAARWCLVHAWTLLDRE